MEAEADAVREELEDRLKTSGVSFPVVAKPGGCGGSFSVTRADNVRQLAEAFLSFKAGLPSYLDTCGLGADSAAATSEFYA